MSRTVLLAGYGAFGALHAAAWRGLPGICVQIAESNAEGRARAVADGYPATEVFAEALEGADIVDIVTPPTTHVPLALAALARGLPVLIEKPATRTVAEALTLADAAEAIPVQVGLILRAHPLTMRARQMLAEGAIGRLVAMSGDFSGWKRMRADSTLLHNDGVHFLDLMRHFAGSPVTEVDASSHARLGGPFADDIRIETRHANGIAGELRLGLVRGGETADSVVLGAVTRKGLTLCGDAGVLTLDFNRNRLFHGRVAYRPSPGGWATEVGVLDTEDLPEVSTVNLLRDGFATFLLSVEGRTRPLCDLSEGAVELARVCTAVEAALARPARAALAVDSIGKGAA